MRPEGRGHTRRVPPAASRSGKPQCQHWSGSQGVLGGTRCSLALRGTGEVVTLPCPWPSSAVGGLYPRHDLPRAVTRVKAFCGGRESCSPLVQEDGALSSSKPSHTS